MKTEADRLKDYELELLALLSEECGEVVQGVGKCIRHGLLSAWPGHPANVVALEEEIGDVLAAVDLLVQAGTLSRGAIEIAQRDKHVRVVKYLHHAAPLGNREAPRDE